MDDYKNEFKGKKAAVLGFGIEGVSSANFLLKNRAEITVFDEKSQTEFDQREISRLKSQGIKFCFGAFAKSFAGFDIVVRSPGIKPEKIKNKIKPETILTSPTQIFFHLCPCLIIGVTGTKGKGTTSTLICKMLEKQGLDVYLGGNIGKPPLDFLHKLKSQSIVVLELSSFQLVDFAKSSVFTKSLVGKPHVAVILMTTSEHLDYHKDVYEYIEAKRNILKFQTESDFAIINADYLASNESDIQSRGKVFKISREKEVEEGCFVKDGKIILKSSLGSGSLIKKYTEVIDVKDVLLPGAHNLENICAAVMVGILSGVLLENIRHVLKTFSGLEHRLELVAKINGVRYYDDSFSTTPETAIAAIEAFPKNHKVLILGGSSKNSDFGKLASVIEENRNSIRSIIGIGEEWNKIKFRINNSEFRIYENLNNMRKIVGKAHQVALPDDVVLLSPACASFDMFKNYKDRGEQFRKETLKLKVKSAKLKVKITS